MSMENHDIYTLRDQKPLNRSTSNLIGVITSGTSPHMQTLVFLSLKGAGLHMREIVIIRVFFLPHPVVFLPPCAPTQVAPFLASTGSEIRRESHNSEIGSGDPLVTTIDLLFIFFRLFPIGVHMRAKFRVFSFNRFGDTEGAPKF